MYERIRELARGEAGQATTEYALLVAIVGLMAMGFQVLFLRGLVKLFDGILFTLSLPFP